ncbi:putative beta-glucosidase D, partial [Aureobasidium melanogenum]
LRGRDQIQRDSLYRDELNDPLQQHVRLQTRDAEPVATDHVRGWARHALSQYLTLAVCLRHILLDSQDQLLAELMKALLIHTLFSLLRLSGSSQFSTMKTAVALFGAATICTASNINNTEEGLITNGLVSLGDWQTAFTKAQNFVSQLTTEEKITIVGAGSLTNGSANWTALTQSDGPQGAQNFYYESAFSMTCALAMTWDKDAIYKQGKAVATEFYQKGLQLLAGPVSNPMGRTAWGGRNGESFGPDSYFNGVLGGISAKAYQAGGVIAGGKHFILYEQETNRSSSSGGGGGMGEGMGNGSMGTRNSSMGSMPSGSAPPGSVPSGMTLRIRADNSSATESAESSTDSAPYSSNIDDKTFRETYLWPWYDIIKGIWNWCGDVRNDRSQWLCGLRRQGSSHEYPQDRSRLPRIRGLDYGSSSTWSTSTVEAFLNNGSLTEARLDDMVIRNVIGYYKA